MRLLFTIRSSKILWILFFSAISVSISWAQKSKVKRYISHKLEAKTQMSTIEERVKKVVIEQLGVSEDQVTPGASFVDDLGADSLDTVELVMALEEEFDAEIPDEEAESITKVQDAISYITKSVA